MMHETNILRIGSQRYTDYANPVMLNTKQLLHRSMNNDIFTLIHFAL